MQKSIDIYRKEKIRELFENIIFFFVFASYFTPASYAIGDRAHDIWQIIVIINSCMAILLYLTLRKMSLHWILFSISAVTYYIISKVLCKSDGSTYVGLLYSLKTIGFISLIDYGFSIDKERFLEVFVAASLVMCGWHYATFVVYRDSPTGMRPSDMSGFGQTIHGAAWFLFSHDNGSAFYFLPVMSLLWYRLIAYGKGLKTTFIYSILIIYMYCSLWSVTAMITTIVSFLGYIVIYSKDIGKKRRLYSYKMIIMISIIISVAIITIVLERKALVSLIGGFLIKSDTFSGREGIWQRTITLISESPITGRGFESERTTLLRIGINHCHNIILQLLYTGGLLAFIPYIGALFACENRDYNNSENQIIAKNCLCIGIIAYFVVASLDFYMYIPIPLLLFILYFYADK